MDKFKQQYKVNFKEEFVKRIEKTYSRGLEHTSNVEKYNVLGQMVREEAMFDWKTVKNDVKEGNKKQVYYFSMEFLLGRMLTNNMINLGIYDEIKDALTDLGIDINEIEDSESDAGLGNGGLGRLAACFMDSIASLGYAGHGNCIRYNYGFFRQKFENGYQVEYPQPWLSNSSNVWEVRKPDDRVTIKFGGKVLMDDKMRATLVDYTPVDAVAYDMPLIGYKNSVTNKLRLWSAEPNMDVPYGPEFDKYESDVRDISNVLYPDDSTREGKLLRLKQQYFFSAAGLAYILKQYIRRHGSLDDLNEHVVIQINDTHPSILVAELMRSLMDEYGYYWDKAWDITTQTLAYTNHTILAEALETWECDVMKELLPRNYQIIEEINKRFIEKIKSDGISKEKIERMAIIKNNRVHMAHLAIVGSFSVNGVAALHTEILKAETIKDFHEYYPNKINNKTNGITHRRWLLNCNPELSNKISDLIGDKWVKNIEQLERLNDNTELIDSVNEIKHNNKQILVDFIKQREGIEVDVNSIFDVQIKRLHAYKRQLMNALHIMYLYNKLKSDKEFYANFHPQTFIFGAKAAPSYVFAKQVIKYINSIANVVNNDKLVSEKMKVVFVQNYNVTYAEKLIPAADISEQISTAGKEASGTGNMKFQMNGAITIGTLDGANVEIKELVGDENIVIFGMDVDEVNALRGNYNPRDIYEKDEDIKVIIDQLMNGFFKDAKTDDFKEIYDELLGRDEYFVLEDFRTYQEAQAKINNMYKDKENWAKMCSKNIANSAFFSTDRTIQDYIDDIWKIDKITK
ncbi:glycogen/starch/alpha-glucan phosphorylase [Mycoplasmatota bacterium WC44]